MPLFVKSKLLFIHIPKSGGTSIERLIERNGESIGLFTDNGSIFINGHTPQHCTFRELVDLNLINDDTRVFTVVRNPIERTISEYFYLKTHRPDIDKLYRSFEGFLDYFLDYRNASLFDNHNLTNFDYLVDHSGSISKKITIFKYFDTDGIESFIGYQGLRDLKFYTTSKEDMNIKDRQMRRMLKYFEKDFEYLQYDC